jgi:hypothetical protein
MAGTHHPAMGRTPAGPVPESAWRAVQRAGAAMPQQASGTRAAAAKGGTAQAIIPSYRSPAQAPQIVKDLFAAVARLARPGFGSALIIGAPQRVAGLLPVYDALFGIARRNGFRTVLARLAPLEIQVLRNDMRDAEQGIARTGSAAAYLKLLGPERAAAQIAALAFLLAKANGLSIATAEPADEASEPAMTPEIRRASAGGRNLLVLCPVAQVLSLQDSLLKGSGKGSIPVNAVSCSFAESFAAEVASYARVPTAKPGLAGRFNFHRLGKPMLHWMPS